MKKKLHDEYNDVGGMAEIDIGAGVVYVHDSNEPTERYKLDPVYRRLLQRAYQMGLKQALPYVPK